MSQVIKCSFEVSVLFDLLRSTRNFFFSSGGKFLYNTKLFLVKVYIVATTVSPKRFFRAPWRVSDSVVGRGNAGWTISNSGHSCLSQNCSQGPPAENTGRGSLLSRPSCPPEDLICRGTELHKQTNKQKK